MRKKMVAVALIALGWAIGAAAHEGHVHRVMGTVAAMDATHIEVDTTDGKHESYPLTPETKYRKGTVPVVPADIERGVRVVLSVVEKDTKRIVSEVIVAGGETPDTGGEHRH